MKIKTDEITSVIKQEIEQFTGELEISEVGRVVEVGDGIARIYGLSKAMSGELLEFDSRAGVVTSERVRSFGVLPVAAADSGGRAAS